MTVATLLLPAARVPDPGLDGASLLRDCTLVGAIVCIAASNGGTTSQDVKTASSWRDAAPAANRDLGGALASALVAGPVLLQLNDTATVYVPAAEVQVEAADLRRRERHQVQGGIARPAGQDRQRDLRRMAEDNTRWGRTANTMVDDAGSPPIWSTRASMAPTTRAPTVRGSPSSTRPRPR